MQQPRWIGVLGVAALLAAGGCEDPPTSVAPAAVSPVPAAFGSGFRLGSFPPSSFASPSASPSLLASPFPSPTATPARQATAAPIATAVPTPASNSTATPTAANTVASPTPSTSPTPAGSASPANTGSAVVFLDAPDIATDFSKSSLTVTLHAEPPSGAKITNLAIIYDSNVIYSQDTTGTLLSVPGWNPNLVNNIGVNSDLTPVPFGSHSLQARATTNAGVVSFSTKLIFNKALTFSGWLTATTVNKAVVQLPALPSSRTGMRLYGSHGYLFGFFGELQGGQPANNVISLSLGVPGSPTWNLQASPNLPWRRHLALAGSDASVYLVGGQPLGTQVTPPATGTPGGGVTLAPPTKEVDSYDVFSHLTTPLADLPVALTDTSAVVYHHSLYVVGGSTTAAASDANRQTFRLALNADDTPNPNSTWVERGLLPAAMRGMVAVVGAEGLYVLGGQSQLGFRSQEILQYDETADTWKRVQLLPDTVSDGAAVSLGGSIFYLGGYDGNGKARIGTLRFDFNDTAHGTPARAFPDGPPNLPSARAQLGAVVIRDLEHTARLFIAGGESPDTNGVMQPLADVNMADTL